MKSHDRSAGGTGESNNRQTIVRFVSDGGSLDGIVIDPSRDIYAPATGTPARMPSPLPDGEGAG